MTKLKQLKVSINMSNKKKTGMILTLAGCLAGNALAGTLTNYTSGDVLVCFRGGSGYDLVVDAGPISTFTNLAANQRYTVSEFNSSQLAYVGINSITWSAFTTLADNTLFVTRPRTVLNTQTSPWQSKSSSNQGATGQRMLTIPLGANDNKTFKPENTSTAVVEEDISAGNPNYVTGSSYRDALLGPYGGNFSGTFQGNPETATLNNFTTGGQVVRADFYQLTPTGGFAFGKFLGYFELNTNGVLSYVAYPSATPVLKTISRAGNVTSIDYTAGLYGTYTLRGTNSAGLTAPRTNWPAITTCTSGDTATHTVTDTTTDTLRFYTITAQ